MPEQTISTREHSRVEHTRMEPLATFHEALAYLNTTERTLRRWLSHRDRNGLQPIARKLGGQWRFKMKLLQDWEPPQ